MNQKELAEILQNTIREKKTAEWADIFDQEGLPYSPVNNIKQIYEDPHIQYQNMLVEIKEPEVGKVKIAGSPLRLSETPGEIYACAPRLGEHTEDILRSILQFSSEEITVLKQEGMINT